MSMEGAESGKRTGAMLLAARNTAGLELADVARETRVPLRHLKALETDAHDQLPALPYAIGFAKSYARAVGLDPEAVADQFRSETSKGAHVPTALALEPLDERRLPSSGLVWLSASASLSPSSAALSAWGAGWFDPPAPTVVATAPPPPVEAAGRSGRDRGADAGRCAVPPAPAAPISAAGVVVLTAKEDVWVKIYDTTHQDHRQDRHHEGRRKLHRAGAAAGPDAVDRQGRRAGCDRRRQAAAAAGRPGRSRSATSASPAPILSPAPMARRPAAGPMAAATVTAGAQAATAQAACQPAPSPLPPFPNPGRLRLSRLRPLPRRRRRQPPSHRSRNLSHAYRVAGVPAAVHCRPGAGCRADRQARRQA